MFIVFEGIDGCGKTTYLNWLVNYLSTKNIQVVCTREPGGTPLAEVLRAQVLQNTYDVLTETLLLHTARLHHLQQLIIPALQAGKWVLCDRFYPSTQAYQVDAKGLNPQTWQTLKNMLPIVPNYIIWFDLDAKIAQQRRAQRILDLQIQNCNQTADTNLQILNQFDQFEQADLSFHQAVAQSFEQQYLQAIRHPQAQQTQYIQPKQAKWLKINAKQTKEQIVQDLQTLLENVILPNCV